MKTSSFADVYITVYSNWVNGVYPIQKEKGRQRLSNPMYVNHYDRFVKQDFEKPTIGILLCERKNDALMELTLPKDANILSTLSS